MTEEEFKNIDWPEVFTIEFLDGDKQSFVSCCGITWDSGENELDKNQGRSNISCCWKKKSPSQKRYRLIQVWIDEIKCIRSPGGDTLWYGQA